MWNSKNCNISSGQCDCNATITTQYGRQCSPCPLGQYYNEEEVDRHISDSDDKEHPHDYDYYDDECKSCDCNHLGTQKDICDGVTGECICKEGYAAPQCDQCSPGLYNFPICSKGVYA